MCWKLEADKGSDAILLSRKASYVVTVDLSVNASKMAKLASRMKNDRGNISLVVGDAEHLPFRDIFLTSFFARTCFITFLIPWPRF